MMSETMHYNRTIIDHIGERLRIERKRLGWTQTALANRIGITFQQVAKYETGQSALPASRLYYIARAMGTDVTRFYDGLITDQLR